MMTRARISLLVAFLSILITQTGFGQSVDQTLIVDRNHSSASDSNPGTADEPLLTINEAAKRAVDNKINYRSTRVIVEDGKYRESIQMIKYSNVVLGPYSKSDPDNATPMYFEARNPGAVIVSGSDVWSDWQPDGDRFVHDWPFDWHDGSEELHLRREIFFVDGERMRQVLSPAEITPGTYYVDLRAAKVYLKPTAGKDLNQAEVEVGVREILWDQRGEFNTFVSGFIFEHAPTEWRGGYWAAFRVVTSKNVIVEKCEFRNNNGYALFFGETENVLLKDSKMNNNGADGWNTWRVLNMVATDNETSYNNWRGAWGNWHGWNVGNKLESTHGLVIRRHKAIGNLSRGLWLDFDMVDVVLDQVEVRDNYVDGLWIEANQGPITVKNSVFCNNHRSGIVTSYSQNIHLDNNLFYKNAYGERVETNDSQLHFRGRDTREIYDFQSGKNIVLVAKDWTLTNNIFVGGDFQARYAKGPTLIDTSLEGVDWDNIVGSLSADYNTYYHPDRAEVFGFPKYNDLTLSQWRESTTQDRNSSFHSEEPPIDCSLDQVRNTDDINLQGEMVGSRKSISRSVSGRKSGAKSVLVRFEAFDVNAMSDVELKINGSFVPLPSTIVSDGKWKSDSIAVSLDGISESGNTLEFTVTDGADGRSPGFKVKNISMEYSELTPGATLESGELPEVLTIGGNYPNPFNPTTALRINLTEAATVSVAIFDLTGRQVLSIDPRELAAGFGQEIIVDASGLTSGTYFYTVSAFAGDRSVVDSGSMVLLK